MQRSIGVLIVLLALSARAHAGNDTDTTAKAEALFDEALKLKEAGKLDEACAKFNEALTNNPNAVGTILNVALCYEQAGRVASAARLFAEARDRAREQNLDANLHAAEDHLAKNEPLVPHVAIQFAEPPTADTKLVVDDQIVPVASANSVPIDPGTRTITVTAPGRVPFETRVEIKPQERKVVDVPKLGYPVVVKKTRRTVGMVVFGVGAAAVITGQIVAYEAHTKYQNALAGCNAMLQCSTTSYADTRNAHQLGNVATGIGIVGGVAVVAGAYLWLFAPKEEAQPPHRVVLVPHYDGTQAGIAAVGRF